MRKGGGELLSKPIMSQSTLSFYNIAQVGLLTVLWHNVKSVHLKQQSAGIGIYRELSIIILKVLFSLRHNLFLT